MKRLLLMLFVFSLLVPVAGNAQDVTSPQGVVALPTFPTLPPLVTPTPTPKPTRTPIIIPTFPTLPPLATSTPTPIIIPTFPTIFPTISLTKTPTPYPESIDRVGILSPSKILDNHLGDLIFVQGILNSCYTLNTATNDTWTIKTSDGLKLNVLTDGATTGDISWLVADGTDCIDCLWRTDGTTQGTYLYEGMVVQSMHNFPTLGILAFDAIDGLYLFHYDPEVSLSSQPADVNGDGAVDSLDIMQISTEWHEPISAP